MLSLLPTPLASMGSISAKVEPRIFHILSCKRKFTVVDITQRPYNIFMGQLNVIHLCGPNGSSVT